MNSTKDVATAPDRSELTIVDHVIDVPGGRVFARQWQPLHADGTPLLLFHDSLGCVDTWRDFPALLAGSTGRRVIAYDRLGFGRSSAHPGKLTATFVRDEAETFVPHLLRWFELERFIPLGHSVGGGMAMYCGATHRHACEAIVTISAQMFAESKTLRSIAEAKDAYADPTRFSKLQKYHGPKTRWVLGAWTDTWLSQEFASWSLRDTLPEITCPVLAIHGELDEFGSLVHPEMVRELVRGPAQALILPDVGHVPHRAQPTVVLDTVARLLERFDGFGPNLQRTEAH